MNQHIAGSDIVARSPRNFTVDEFERMGTAGVFGPDERVELLAGEIFVMSPAGRFHEVLRTELAQHWARSAPAAVKVVSELQLRLSDTHQPVVDIGMLPGPLLAPDARGPDMLLVVEIADTSWQYDTTIKRAAYAASGVREYWVIEARARSTRVHRDPQPDGTYTTTFEVPGDQTVTPLLVPGLAIRFADLPAV